MTSILYFTLGFSGSFFGTIPLGPINLSVVDTTLKEGVKSAMALSIAAAIIEFVYTFFSYHFSAFLTNIFIHNPRIPYCIGVLFFLAGTLLMFKKNKTKPDDSSVSKGNSFCKGLILAILNPLAIPFWLFLIGYYQMHHLIAPNLPRLSLLVLIFVSGAATGKITSLYLFSLASYKISHRLSYISLYMNKVIGVVLIIIGLSQLIS